MFLPDKKYFILLLLVSLGLSNALVGQKIVIREADSSWMGQDIPAKALAEKPFSFNRRWYQNLVTRFNYYYNAQQTLQKCLEEAQHSHQDNYDSLLSLDPYDKQDFQMLRGSLDSVILNAGIGIEVHDPRGKWIDDLYLLVGQAYYYEQDYQQAAAAFEYTIKNLGARDEMDRPALIGSRAYQPESNISVVSPEKKNMNHPPARNDAFIWLIRTYLDSGYYDGATALINSLKSDPALPERLSGPLQLLEARYYFATEKTDSAMGALVAAIPLQQDKDLQARWQFVVSQLYERQKQWDKALAGYQQVEAFHPPPLMHFYARLSQIRIRVLQDPSGSGFARSSQPLVDMAKKERYARYRSIIYYHLGRLALQVGQPEMAIAYLKKSLLFNPKESAAHQRSYRLLADYYYSKQQYRPSRLYYDSTAAAGPAAPLVTVRKEALATVVKNLDVIAEQDSLLRLAGLPNDSLMAILGDIVEDSMRQRKKRNRILKDDENKSGGLFGRKEETQDLTAPQTKGGDWYFYNNIAKSKGFSTFHSEWGDRPLGDNWRLSQPNQPVGQAQEEARPILAGVVPEDAQGTPSEDLLAQLMAPLPLTPETKESSTRKKMEARHGNVDVFFLQLEDDTATLAALDLFLQQHPQNPYLADAYYKYYLIYTRMPDLAKAAHYKQLLLSAFPDSKYAAALGAPEEETQQQALAGTIMQLYDSAYVAYLTGDYAAVPALRERAAYLDAANAQKARFSLLAAMTVLKTQSDSAGRVALEQVVRQEAKDTAIVEQARRILHALDHKAELVEHLVHLQLPEQQTQAPALPPSQQQDSTTEQPGYLPLQALQGGQEPANRQEVKLSRPGQAGQLNRPELDSSRQAQLAEEAKAQMAAQTEEETATPDSAVVSAPAAMAAKPATPYTLERNIPYFVILSFRRVDADLIKTTLSAFSAYNRKNHQADSVEVSSFVLAHNQVILIFRLFKNETEALLYYGEIKQKAKADIIPKVPPSYYRLFFISRSNFILLNRSQDFEEYLNFFYQHYK